MKSSQKIKYITALNGICLGIVHYKATPWLKRCKIENDTTPELDIRRIIALSEVQKERKKYSKPAN